jgi:hypothetical protein
LVSGELLWLRMAPDGVFILVGVLRLVAAAVWGFLDLRPLCQPATPQLETGTVRQTELVGV